MAKALLIITGIALLLGLAVSIKAFAATYGGGSTANLQVLHEADADF